MVILEAHEDYTLSLCSEVAPSVDVVRLKGPLFKRLLSLREVTQDTLVHFQFWGGKIWLPYRIAFYERHPLVATYQNVYSRMRGRTATVIDRLLSSQCDAVIAVSQAVATYCTEKVGIPARKVHLIRNAIALDASIKSRAAVERGAVLRLVTVARLSEQKNHALLLDALAVARTKGIGVHLSVVGDGPLFFDLVQRSRALGLQDEVEWLGEVWSSRLVRTVLEECDAYVSASLWEGLPLSLLEAAAYGLPAIVSDIRPHHEVLGDAGIYFSPANAGSLVDVIEKIASGELLLADRAARASTTVRRHYGIDRAAQEHIALYKSLVNA